MKGCVSSEKRFLPQPGSIFVWNFGILPPNSGEDKKKRSLLQIQLAQNDLGPLTKFPFYGML